MSIAFVREATCCAVFLGSVVALSSSASAADFTVTFSSGTTSDGSGCLEECTPALDVPCSISCADGTRFLSEYANVVVTITPISIEASGVADAVTFGGPKEASAEAYYRIDFTIDQTTFYYSNWNVFFPPSDTNFLPSNPPINAEFIGSLDPGAYYIEGSCSAISNEFEANGLLFRLIPDYFADCDNDGTFDWREIADGTQQDLNFNGIPDECETTSSPADLNDDGTVDAADLGILLGAWGTTGPGDLDANSIVNAADLGILLGAWGD